MGLEAGWVTDVRHGLSPNQQLTALGNGVLPLQAVAALTELKLSWEPTRPASVLGSLDAGYTSVLSVD
ncbi:hypothetical protein [Micropruina sonneratiae]|uniref:hypothetical protein n=1 Tax=Micropruina sonneratiae TaxID=2986940 RepID=UPI002225CA75|nr:hypothetical protein [Micropruina sp. KQZ13P-5]MCW3157682.1 hypothetical protein [Micropruina sp. KQZ13P-5]